MAPAGPQFYVVLKMMRVPLPGPSAPVEGMLWGK